MVKLTFLRKIWQKTVGVYVGSTIGMPHSMHIHAC